MLKKYKVFFGGGVVLCLFNNPFWSIARSGKLQIRSRTDILKRCADTREMGGGCGVVLGLFGAVFERDEK